MSKYQIWITAHDGEDVPQEMGVWDSDYKLELRLAAFAKDAIITIEPVTEEL